MWVRSLGQEDPLKEGTATHSSLSAWRTPWTDSLVGYSPWGQKESDTTEVTEHHICIYTAHIGLSETNKKMSKSLKRPLKFLLWNKKKKSFFPPTKVSYIMNCHQISKSHTKAIMIQHMVIPAGLHLS